MEKLGIKPVAGLTLLSRDHFPEMILAADRQGSRHTDKFKDVQSVAITDLWNHLLHA